MIVYFFAKTLGFDVLSQKESVIPEGAVEISVADYSRLFEGQSQLKRIAADALGYPVLVEQPEASSAVRRINERDWRDRQLKGTDSLVFRHRDEVENGLITTLLTHQYVELQNYRRALRSWPESDRFPSADHRPTAPDWVGNQIQ